MIKSTIAALALGTGVLLNATGAQAADPFIDPGHDWTGVYVGVQIGYGDASVDGLYDSSDGVSSFLLNNSGAFKLNGGGVLGGIEAGYNWQTGNLLLGLEADASILNWKDQEGPNGDDERVEFDANWLATARLRAGYAVDNFLIFGTAGAAFTDADYFATDNFPSNSDSGSKSFGNIGLAVGGGIEYAFAQNWSFKAEGLYLLFNDKIATSTLTSDSDADDFAELNDAFVARVGLNYHF